MRVPRLRIRALLVLIALIALALGGWRMWKRREVCLGLARERTTEAEGLDLNIHRFVHVVDHWRTEQERLQRQPREEWPHYIESPFRNARRIEEDVLPDSRARAARAHSMAARYRYVADHPWLPLP